MLKLPLLTFLNGPPGCGKSTLMRLIQEDMDGAICPMSFKSPARSALLACHYPHLTMTLPPNLEDPTILARPIDGAGITHGEWLESFTKWLKGKVGKDALGNILRRDFIFLESSWPKFLVDDLGTEDDARPLVGAVGGSEHTLIIHLRRHGCEFKDDSSTLVYGQYLGHHIGIDNNAKPEDMLDRLRGMVGDTQSSSHPIEGFTRPLRR